MDSRTCFSFQILVYKLTFLKLIQALSCFFNVAWEILQWKDSVSPSHIHRSRPYTFRSLINIFFIKQKSISCKKTSHLDHILILIQVSVYLFTLNIFILLNLDEIFLMTFQNSVLAWVMQREKSFQNSILLPHLLKSCMYQCVCADVPTRICATHISTSHVTQITETPALPKWHQSPMSYPLSSIAWYPPYSS